MKDLTKTGLIIVLALCLLGGAYWLGSRPGSGDAKVIVRERKVAVRFDSLKLDTLPAKIKWYPKVETLVDSAEILKLIEQRDSLAVLLQRQNIDYVANLDTIYGKYRDSLNIQYSELYKRWNRVWIGFGPREATVRDSIITLPNSDWFYLGAGLNLGAGWGNNGFSPQVGGSLQIGIKIKSF